MTTRRESPSADGDPDSALIALLWGLTTSLAASAAEPHAPPVPSKEAARTGTREVPPADTTEILDVRVVAGAASAGRVWRGLWPISRRLAWCYRKHLPPPVRTATTTVTIDFGPLGKAEDHRLEGDGSDVPTFTACIAQSIRGLRLPTSANARRPPMPQPDGVAVPLVSKPAPLPPTTIAMTVRYRPGAPEPGLTTILGEPGDYTNFHAGTGETTVSVHSTSIPSTDTSGLHFSVRFTARKRGASTTREGFLLYVTNPTAVARWNRKTPLLLTADDETIASPSPSHLTLIPPRSKADRGRHEQLEARVSPADLRRWIAAPDAALHVGDERHRLSSATRAELRRLLERFDGAPPTDDEIDVHVRCLTAMWEMNQAGKPFDIETCREQNTR